MKKILLIVLSLIWVSVPCKNGWGPDCHKVLNTLTTCQQKQAKLACLAYTCEIVYPESC